MITIDNVSKWYGSFQVLTDCTTEVAKGEVVVVCGPSGSGKSTIIKCVNALEPFQKGEITVEGISVGDPKTNLPKLRSRIGMVFQNFELFPHMSVTENLTLGQVKVLGRSQEEARAKGLKLLERVGLSAHKDKFPGQLSGRIVELYLFVALVFFIICFGASFIVKRLQAKYAVVR